MSNHQHNKIHSPELSNDPLFHHSQRQSTLGRPKLSLQLSAASTDTQIPQKESTGDTHVAHTVEELTVGFITFALRTSGCPVCQ